MQSSIESDWQIIAATRPRLQPQVVIHSQCFRNQRWYVVCDVRQGRYLRIDPAVHSLIARLNGLTISEIISQIEQTTPELLPDNQAVVRILSQLFQAGMLQDQLPVRARQLLQQVSSTSKPGLLQRFNPLSVKIPLGNPDRLIHWICERLPGAFLHWAMLWCLVVGIGILLGLMHSDTLLNELDSDIITPSNLLQLTLLFILMKVIHELAHGVAVRSFGGTVNEMGISLLVLAPVPYTDTSSAWLFQDKYKRILVGLAGMLVELFIAAVALCIWLLTAPGVVHDLALHLFIIGAVSSLLFNGNPFLKFDGYYVLQDWVEIPNLYSRSSAYYVYLIQRYLLGIAEARSPVSANGEAAWFVVYGLLALLNRLVLLGVIVFYLLEHFLIIGMLLAGWALLTQLCLPCWRGLRFLFVSEQLSGRRFRGAAAFFLCLMSAYVVLYLTPVTLRTHSEGVVWVSPEAEIYSEADGFVEQIVALPGSQVETGQLLLKLNPERLEARVRKLEARHRELSLEIAAQSLNRRMVSDIARMDLATVEAQLQLLQQQKQSLAIRARVAGLFVVPDAEQLVGRYIERGTLLGYVYGPQQRIVRAAIQQKNIGLIQQQTLTAEIRVASLMTQTIPSHITRQQPGGSHRLPNQALGAAGGGTLAVQRTGEGLQTVENTFVVDLELPEEALVAGIGERAYIRFVHGEEPLLLQWLRRTKQLFMGQLAVFG
ncbi:MAG: hypothetical protein OIF55_14275 [Amphritea sp.]|nr:hypothetical protein [Amphritea sp.]